MSTVPAAGWIHDLEVRPAEDGGEGEVLWASVEWVGDARKMIKGRKYKLFSPAIDWGGMDKKPAAAQEPGSPQVH